MNLLKIKTQSEKYNKNILPEMFLLNKGTTFICFGGTATATESNLKSYKFDKSLKVNVTGTTATIVQGLEYDATQDLLNNYIFSFALNLSSAGITNPKVRLKVYFGSQEFDTEIGGENYTFDKWVHNQALINLPTTTNMKVWLELQAIDVPSGSFEVYFDAFKLEIDNRNQGACSTYSRPEETPIVTPLLLEVITNTSTITTPVIGMLVQQTNSPNGVYNYDGTAWIKL